MPADDPFKYIAGLDQKVAAWNQLIKKHKGTQYEFLARVEEERIDRAKVAFVEANRYRLKDGNQLTIVGYSQLVTKHEQSKNIHRYLIDFGDFYMVLAKEYASQYDPEGLAFDFNLLDQFVKSALKFYSEVAQIDGDRGKSRSPGKDRSDARLSGKDHETQSMRLKISLDCRRAHCRLGLTASSCIRVPRPRTRRWKRFSTQWPTTTHSKAAGATPPDFSPTRSTDGRAHC